MMTESKHVIYIFASPSEAREKSPATVLCRVEGEPLANTLCSLLAREYADAKGLPAFHHQPATSFSTEDQVLMDESLDWLAVYDEPDPGVYDPPPSQHTLSLAQFARRAQKWEQMLRGRAESAKPDGKPEAGGAAPSEPPTTDHPQGMPPEDWRNAGLILLMMLAQAYYKMLESTISMASWVTALDLELNQSYFWTVKNITNLLKNHEDLKDFPGEFEPLFTDLYPSTIGDLDWEDMVAPDAERFLSTVQQYVHSKGVYDPAEGSPAWILVEMFRPSVNTAIERAVEYNKLMRQHAKRMFGSPNQAAPPSSPGPSASENPAGTKAAGPCTGRDKVFISYSHKDRKFLDDLLAHLRPLERTGRVSAWSDKQIQPGSLWFDKIREALAVTKVAVLLVTKDFLASDFIDEHELGPLLKEAATGGVEILWVLVRDCNWKNTPLKDYQAAFRPEKPLAEMKAERDSAWVAICRAIEAAANAR